MMRTDQADCERAIAGLLAVADSNFPGCTDIQLAVHGANKASVLIPASVLRAMLKASEDARHRI